MKVSFPLYHSAVPAKLNGTVVREKLLKSEIFNGSAFPIECTLRSRSSDKKGMEEMRNDGKEGERSSYRSETSCPAKRYQLADSRDPVANAVQS